MWKSFGDSLSLLTHGIDDLFNWSHSRRCRVASCGFNLHFPNHYWYWTSFLGLPISQHNGISCEECTKICGSFFKNWTDLFLLLSLKSFCIYSGYAFCPNILWVFFPRSALPFCFLIYGFSRAQVLSLSFFLYS